MSTLKKIKNLAPLLLLVFLDGCQYPEFEIPGHITGEVKDAVTKEPVEDALVKVSYPNGLERTDTTGMNGKFRFTNLEEARYSIEVNKDLYDTYTGNIIVNSETTADTTIELKGVPNKQFSTSSLHFGLESAQMSFSISNSGGGYVSYEIDATEDWIEITPESGRVTQQPQPIQVTIQKEAMPEKSHHAWIVIHSEILEEILTDSIDVYVNYVMDEDSIFYKTVKIGTQVWMAENLNTGIMVDATGEEFPTRNNGIFEKLCYRNDSLNCETLGGLYMWKEMMDYAPADTLGNRTTQGICPDGWHIPTHKEWEELQNFLGEDVAGGKLKDTSDLWEQKNEGASNETGFSALPAGVYQLHYVREGFMNFGKKAYFWTTYYDASNTWKTYQLMYYDTRLIMGEFSHRLFYPDAMSVRCVKDP